MQHPARTRLTGVVLGVAALLTLSACGGSEGANPLEEEGQAAAGGEIVVGSANFPENVLLGEIYAQALEANDVQVRRQFNIGSREVIYGQIESGALTILPEYNGALLAHLEPEAEATTTEEVNTALQEALPDSLELLESAEAENKDGIAVTAETAETHGLTTIADLAPVAGELVMGGPPEFVTRYQGLVGMEQEYGIQFKEFRELDVGGPITVSALRKGDIQVANLFTTDPSFEQYGFVLLEDPKDLFSAQNVTPLVHADSVTGTVRDTLNGISAKLDTPGLTKMVKRVVADTEDPAVVAEEWLTEQGLV